jgi:hypothetical protein
VQRRRQLQRLAEVKLPSLALERLNLQHDRILDEQVFGVWKALSDYAVPVEEALRAGHNPCTVYHVHNLDAKIAADLFNAGFRDVDSVDDSGRTPLMRLGCQHPYDMPLAEILRLGIWLTSKGADIRRNLPDFNGSVGHQIGGNLGFYLVYG